MNKTLLLLLPFVTSIALGESHHGELIFKDDFERSESQEEKDEPGNGWGTNSKSRAAGNKQVDLRDGAMYIYIHEAADHGVSVTQPIAFEDGTVSLRFMLENEKDSLGLNFADLGFKEVHAGHLFMVIVDTKSIQMKDLKSGQMRLDIRTARKAKQPLSAEQEKAVEGTTKRVPAKVAVAEWHDLSVQVEGDTMTVTLDGKEAGSFSSKGIAHPTKKMLRIAVNRDAVVDDVKIWRKK